MMDWRQWVHDRLQTQDILDATPGGIHGAGAINGCPSETPFITVRLGLRLAVLNEADAPYVTHNEATVFVHDKAGSYDRIDDLLDLVRARLVGQVPLESAIACTWQGDSGESADEFYGTLTRNGSYRLTGRI